jgi:hypothetical protein
MQFCDGTNWISMTGSSSGGAVSRTVIRETSPSLAPGHLVHHFRVGTVQQDLERRSKFAARSLCRDLRTRQGNHSRVGRVAEYFHRCAVRERLALWFWRCRLRAVLVQFDGTGVRQYDQRSILLGLYEPSPRHPRHEPSDRPFVGMVAQDVQKVFPEAVAKERMALPVTRQDPSTSPS